MRVYYCNKSFNMLYLYSAVHWIVFFFLCLITKKKNNNCCNSHLFLYCFLCCCYWNLQKYVHYFIAWFFSLFFLNFRSHISIHLFPLFEIDFCVQAFVSEHIHSGCKNIEFLNIYTYLYTIKQFYNDSEFHYKYGLALTVRFWILDCFNTPFQAL